MSEIQKLSWKSKEVEKLSDSLSRQAVYGEKGTLAQMFIRRGGGAARHSHIAGEVLVVPPNVPHAIIALEDTVDLIFFSPAREDWVRGEDQYLRKQPKAETVAVGAHRGSS